MLVHYVSTSTQYDEHILIPQMQTSTEQMSSFINCDVDGDCDTETTNDETHRY
jgi:hypothetical protein